MENKKSFEPYSYFFSIGLVSAAVGVLLWILFSLQLLSFYPRQAHANLMFFGFFWSFIAGFLMTAIPKMTQAKPAHLVEIYFGLSLVFIQAVLNLLNAVNFSILIYWLQMLFLTFFMARRFLQKKQLPFEGFVFLPFAFVMSFLGLLIYTFDNSKISLLYTFSGQAFVLNLICGLGSRLIPLLSRLPSSPSPELASEAIHRQQRIIYFGFIAIGLNISFVLEAIGKDQYAYILRTLVFAWVTVKLFRVFQKPQARTFVGWGLKAGILAIFLSYMSLATGAVKDSLGHLHIMYIAGLSLINLMVATRVTVAHGGGFLDIELKTKALAVIAGLFWISAFARTMVGLSLVSSFILTAAIIFILAIGVWALRFYKILWKY